MTAPIQFTYARHTQAGVASSQQTAQNFALTKLRSLQSYVTDNGLRAYMPNDYDIPASLRAANGALVLSFGHKGPALEEDVSLVVQDTAASVSHIYAWAFSAAGTQHVVDASADFTALLRGYPESSWLPAPPETLQRSILSDYDVYLTWRDDNPTGSI